MKKILSLALALFILISTFAISPLAADEKPEVEDYAVYLDNGVHLLFNLTDGSSVCLPVAAKEMGDLKSVVGHDATWSVLGYAEELLADPDLPAHTSSLVSAMLAYGAAAQKYFNYKTDALVSTQEANIEMLASAPTPDAETIGGDVTYLGATLLLKATLALRFYFIGTDVTATVNGKDAEVECGDGYAYVEIPVMPYEMSDTVTVCAGATTVTYAPLNYLKNMLNSDNPDLVSLVASIYAYGVAAESYRAASSCSQHGAELASVISEQPATAFSEGYTIGYCACGEIAIKVRHKTRAEVIAPSESAEYYHTHTFGDILTEDILAFYPTEDDPDGRSLYIEYSMLFNDSLENTDGESFIAAPVFSKQVGMKKTTFEPVLIYPNDNRGFPAGAIDIQLGDSEDDYNDERITYYENDVVVVKSDSNGKSYYVINDLYGWHRIGCEITQLASINNDNYKVETAIYMTVYVDGVKVLKADMTDVYNEIFYFYTASLSGDKIVYKDITSNNRKWGIDAIALQNLLPTSGTGVYLPIADVYVTCGNGFVVKVKPTENPTVHDFVQGDVTIKDVKTHFATE